tara:strand:+ start:11090 stop:11734 length:645 start_codon:yes stop_codon:yes gene_type:complete
MAEETKVLTLPEGRLINASLHVQDVYIDPKTQVAGTPQYNLELVFDPVEVQGEGTIEDALIDAAVAEWGDMALDEFEEGKLIMPFLDGDKMAANREANGKVGDAYKGKIVIRSNTQFNKFGQKGAGGIQVYDENVNEVGPVNAHVIYPGCYGIAAVTVGVYETNRHEHATKFYLTAFQKTRDGEKLVTNADYSTLFKPMSNGGGEGRTTRRRRG